MNFKLSADTFVVFSVLALIFSACGGDSGSSANDNLPESVEQFSDIKNIECNVDRECAQIYIEEHDDYVQCIDSKWETVVASKPNKACSNAKSSSSKNKSSSSKGKSSSSKKNQSSSSSLQKGMDKSVYDDSKNTLTDYRNGITYKTVKIGDQIWMAENLNYDYNSAQFYINYCYNKNADSCAKYGRYYNWAAAMDSAAVFNSNALGCGLHKACKSRGIVRGVCPRGWHLPSMDEWNVLFDKVGGFDKAGIKLKSTSGWEEFDGKSGNGKDSYGFSARPVGLYNSRFKFMGKSAYFWSSTEKGLSDAFVTYMGYYYDWALLFDDEKNMVYPVRCLKNSDSDSGSSLEKTPSSSSYEPITCDESIASGKDKSEYDASANTLKDLRDNHVYRTVTIGSQIWMAENLNLAYEDVDECGSSGRIYSWTSAIDTLGKYSDDGKNCYDNIDCISGKSIRGLCPNGWHLPSNQAWLTLFDNVGGLRYAKLKLSADREWGFSYGECGLGLDSYGFSILPMYYGGGHAQFWTGSFSRWMLWGYYLTFEYSEDEIDFRQGQSGDYGSIRCVKDADSGGSLSSDFSYVKPSTVVRGTMTDDRDGKTYKTVSIGSQTWMAENLNYDYNKKTAKSYCYNDVADSCAKYGRLYTFAAAMDSAALFGDAGKGCGYGKVCYPDKHTRGVCPSGWHLPNDAEWQVLFFAFNVTYTDGGRTFRSVNGWNGIEGDDDYGFSALPAGVRYDGGKFDEVGDYTSFWVNSEIDFNYSYRLEVDNYWSLWRNANKSDAYSVRCIKDDD